MSPRVSNGVNLLAIETSGPVLSVAVKKGKNKTREASFKGYSRHVENLLPLIDKLLKKEKLKIRDIGVFLISRGPGSFTGLRVGFATLKGFLSVRPRPCFGALSFDLVAAGVKQAKGYKNLAVCLNAKRDKLYVRSYRYHNKGWKTLKTPLVVSPEAWAKELPKGTLIAGDGLETCIRGQAHDLIRFKKEISASPCQPSRIKTGRQGQALIDCLSPHLRIFPKKFWAPRASTLISLYEKKDPLLKRLEKPKELLPVYLRASEAEERLKTRKK